MYISDFTNVLFKRTLKAAVRSDDEDKACGPVSLVVTKEANGYAAWYVFRNARIIAFGQDRDAVIKYAATVDHEKAEDYADEGSCNYNLPQSHLPELHEQKAAV